jgi:hypothetical protein
MNKIPDIINNIEPTVNLKLSDYNKIISYIQTLEEMSYVNDEPFKSALEKIIMTIFNHYSVMSDNMIKDIHNILIENKLIIERNGSIMNSNIIIKKKL